jgi:hypothetical protein
MEEKSYEIALRTLARAQDACRVAGRPWRLVGGGQKFLLLKECASPMAGGWGGSGQAAVTSDPFLGHTTALPVR